MAEPITNEQLIRASQNCETLDDVTNGDENSNATSPGGRVYPTIAKALYQVIQAGGYESFLTESALLASVPSVPKKAAKALDTHKIWYWNGSSWIDTGLSELDQAKADATTKANAAKSEAISSAATDATTKANAAETNAINQAIQFTVRATYKPSSNGVLRVPYTPIGSGVDNDISHFVNNGDHVAYFKDSGLYAEHYTLNGKKLENSNMKLLNVPSIPETKQSVIEILGVTGAVGVGEGWIDVNEKSYGLISSINVPFSPADNGLTEQYILPNGYVLYPPENVDPPVVITPDTTYQQKFPTWVSNGTTTTVYDETGLKATVNKAVLAPFAISEKVAVGVVDDNKWFGVTPLARQMAISTSEAIFPNPDRYLVIIPTYGQSLSVGSGGVPIYTTVDKNPLPNRLLKFKDFSVTFNRTGGSGVIRVIEPSELTDFEPLAAFDLGNNYSGETLAEQMIIQLSNKIDGSGGVRFLTYAAGVGGSTIDQLGQGSDGYQTFMNALTGAKNIAAKKGWKVIVPAFVWQHGESGLTDTGYKTKLSALRTQMQTDIKAITGQSMNVHCYVANPSTARSLTQYASSQAMYELSRDDSSNFTQVGGVYECQPYSDFTHLTTRGYTLLGHKYADAIYYDLINGFGSYKAVTPKIITRTNNVIDIEFYVPKPPLKFMTNDVVYDIANKGFTYTDSTSSATISSVDILPDGKTVRITLSATPTGANKKIRAGWNGSTADYIGRQRTNLCDSNNGKSVMNDDLNHFCLTFEENLA